MIAKMELCTPPPIPKSPPPLHPYCFSPTTLRFQPLLRCTTHSLSLHNHSLFSFGLKHERGSSLRSKTSEEISADTTVYVKDESKTQLVENTEDYDSQLNRELQEGSLFDNLLKLFNFLEGLNIKLDYEETCSFLAFGSGGAVALWLVATIVSAIDSIPVLPKALELVGLGYTLWFSSRYLVLKLPKALELVGLGYTLWFSSRYLVLKKNREELFARVEQLKQQVLGSEDD